MNKNQDILTQLAQGTGNDDANTGILGTGIGAVKGVNTYKPAYNAQGQIVGSVATDAAGNAVGGPAGITTNVVGGIGLPISLSYSQMQLVQNFIRVLIKLLVISKKWRQRVKAARKVRPKT